MTDATTSAASSNSQCPVLEAAAAASQPAQAQATNRWSRTLQVFGTITLTEHGAAGITLAVPSWQDRAHDYDSKNMADSLRAAIGWMSKDTTEQIQEEAGAIRIPEALVPAFAERLLAHSCELVKYGENYKSAQVQTIGEMLRSRWMHRQEAAAEAKLATCRKLGIASAHAAIKAGVLVPAPPLSLRELRNGQPTVATQNTKPNTKPIDIQALLNNLISVSEELKTITVADFSSGRMMSSSMAMPPVETLASLEKHLNHHLAEALSMAYPAIHQTKPFFEDSSVNEVIRVGDRYQTTYSRRSADGTITNRSLVYQSSYNSLADAIVDNRLYRQECMSVEAEENMGNAQDLMAEQARYERSGAARALPLSAAMTALETADVAGRDPRPAYQMQLTASAEPFNDWALAQDDALFTLPSGSICRVGSVSDLANVLSAEAGFEVHRLERIRVTQNPDCDGMKSATIEIMDGTPLSVRRDRAERAFGEAEARMEDDAQWVADRADTSA